MLPLQPLPSKVQSSKMLRIDMRGTFLTRCLFAVERALLPSEIVNELDKFIIGQAEAKKAVAIALRNRWRRRQLSPDLASEIIPKNILMIGTRTPHNAPCVPACRAVSLFAL